MQQLCLTKAIWQRKVAIALEVPTEAKLCLSPPITPPVTNCISAQVLPVLHTQRRTIDVMLPDGNCLFRAFTKALFAVQSGHITLRKLLVTFIESNGRVFKGLCNGTLQSHCARMRKVSTFGTQAKLQAAAPLFQVFVYVFYKRSEERGWEWMWYKPYSKERFNCSDIDIPEAPDNFCTEILCNEAGSHFDLIVPMNSQHILPPPQLPDERTTFAIGLS